MEDQDSIAVLARGGVFLAWFVSAIFSLIWLFVFGLGVLMLGLPFAIQFFMPLIAAAAWVVGYRLRLRSPWIESIALSAPALQVLFFSTLLFSTDVSART